MSPVGASPARWQRAQARAQELARHLTRRLPPSIDPRDLAQEGLTALADSPQVWAQEDEARFDAHALVRMRGAMVDALRRDDPAGRVQRTRARLLARAQTRLTHALGREPRTSEVACALGWSVNEVFACQAETGQLAMHVDEVTEADWAAVAQSPAVQQAADPSDRLVLSQARTALAAAVAQLAPHERAILTLHTEHDWLYWQIGKWLGVSESRAQQLGQEALVRLSDLAQGAAVTLSGLF